MGDGITVQVEGVARFAATTADAGRQLSTLDRGSAAAGRELSRRAAAKAPKRTGRLAASIRPVATPPGVTVATAPLTYANVQNYGWAAHNITATYYLTGTLDPAESDILDIYTKDADRVLDTVRGQ